MNTITLPRETVQQALDALEGYVPHYVKDRGYPPIITLSTALAEQPADDAKKDAALKACVEALDFYGRYILRRASTGEVMTLTPIDHDGGDRARAAITQAQEQLK